MGSRSDSQKEFPQHKKGIHPFINNYAIKLLKVSSILTLKERGRPSQKENNILHLKEQWTYKMTREWILQRNISQSKELHDLQAMDHIKVTRFDPLKRIWPNKGDTYWAEKIQAHSQSNAWQSHIKNTFDDWSSHLWV